MSMHEYITIGYGVVVEEDTPDNVQNVAWCEPPEYDEFTKRFPLLTVSTAGEGATNWRILIAETITRFEYYETSAPVTRLHYLPSPEARNQLHEALKYFTGKDDAKVRDDHPVGFFAFADVR